MSNYNGYTNYETWAVALWLDNEEPSYRYWRERATEARRWAKRDPMIQGSKVWTPEEAAKFNLAETLKEEIQEGRPEVQGMYGDLLGAALEEVNWNELAGHLLESK